MALRGHIHFFLFWTVDMSKIILTPEYLNSLIIKEEYIENTVGGKVWLSCYLWVAPTHAVVSEPCAAMYPETSDPVKARQTARKRAFDQLWALESYRLMVNAHHNTGASVDALAERIRRIEVALEMPAAELTYQDKIDAAVRKQENTPPTQPEPVESAPPRKVLEAVTELSPEITRSLVRLEDEVTNICGAVMKLRLFAVGPVNDERINQFSGEFLERLHIEVQAPGFDADSFDIYAFCRMLTLDGMRVEADILNRSNTAWVDGMSMEKVKAEDTEVTETVKPIIVGDGLLQGFRAKEYLVNYDQAVQDIKKSISQRAMLSVDFTISHAADEDGRDIYWELDEMKERFDNAISSANFSVANPAEEILTFLSEVFQLPRDNFKLALLG